jgi:hypothetical protein
LEAATDAGLFGGDSLMRNRTPTRRARDTAADEWRSAFKRTVE